MKNGESIKYKIGREISSSVFNIVLNPQIFNNELIPTTGKIILCGNHLHVWDQFPVMCSTKRTIHWLAKKEYFDGKLGPVFNFMECIPVDRAGNTSLATESAIKYLNNDSAIGIFPEGTRNGLKDKHIKELYDKYIIDETYDDFSSKMKKNLPKLSQVKYLEDLLSQKKITVSELKEALNNVNETLKKYKNNGKISDFEYQDSKLLPMYSGAVRMAKSTDALIVPFAVAGSYKIGNKDLKVSFANPISVSNISEEEAMKQLRSSILNEYIGIENSKVYKKL